VVLKIHQKQVTLKDKILPFEMNGKAIKELINENKHLFWYTPGNRIHNLGEDQLVETILNYSDENAS